LHLCAASTACATDEGGHFSLSAEDDHVDDDLSKPSKDSGMFHSASSVVTCTSTQSNASGESVIATTEDRKHNIDTQLAMTIYTLKV
jgi:hypothetical protein